MPELLSLKRRKQIFYTLLAMLVLTGVAYGYVLNQTVVQIVERKDIAAEMDQLSTRVGELEQQYLAAQDEITIEYARALGFQDISDPKYIARGDSGNFLTANVTANQ